MHEFESLLTTTGFVLVALTALWLLARLVSLQRSRARPVVAGRALWWLRAAGSAGLALTAAGLLAYLFSVQRGSFFMPSALKATIAALVVACVVVEVIARGRAPRTAPSRWTWVRSALATLTLSATGAGLVLLHAGVRDFAPESAQTLLALPFDGHWVVTGGGPTSKTNHHHRIASQRHAVDLARVCDDGRLFRGRGETPEESCTWDAMVRSPVDGTVVTVVDGLSDRGSREQLAGNHVIIRIDAQRHVALAHLRQGSISVAAGDAVRTGQPIARAGSSGNTDFPHLHVHVQDAPVYDLRLSRSIPFRFRDVELRRYLWWRHVASLDLLGNDHLRPAHGAR